MKIEIHFTNNLRPLYFILYNGPVLLCTVMLEENSVDRPPVFVQADD